MNELERRKMAAGCGFVLFLYAFAAISCIVIVSVSAYLDPVWLSKVYSGPLDVFVKNWYFVVFGVGGMFYGGLLIKRNFP